MPPKTATLRGCAPELQRQLMLVSLLGPGPALELCQFSILCVGGSFSLGVIRCCSTTGRPLAGPMLHFGMRTAVTSARVLLHPCSQDTASEHAAGPEQADPVEAPRPPSGAAAAARHAAHSASAAARQAGEAVQDTLASAARHVCTPCEATAVIVGLLLITLLAGYGAATLLRPQGSSQVKREPGCPGRSLRSICRHCVAASPALVHTRCSCKLCCGC